MTRFLGLIALCVVLAGCASNRSVEDSAPRDLGAFRLGHNIVVASKMQMVPLSRKATEEEWITSLTDALAARFDRYDGDQFYHFGISVEGYALAPPGVPLVATPKSALVINVTIWDDAEAAKINEEPHQIVVLESLGEGLIVGSGYTSTREEQMADLSFNAARAVERWLAQQHSEGAWFARKNDEEEAAETSAAAEVLDTDQDSAIDPDIVDDAVEADPGIEDEGALTVIINES